MTCTACGSTALAAVNFPDDATVVAVVCLACGRPQPVGEEAGPVAN